MLISRSTIVNERWFYWARYKNPPSVHNSERQQCEVCAVFIINSGGRWGEDVAPASDVIRLLRRSERRYVSPRQTSGSSLIEGQQQVDRLSVCLNAAPALPRALCSLSPGRCQLTTRCVSVADGVDFPSKLHGTMTTFLASNTQE